MRCKSWSNMRLQSKRWVDQKSNKKSVRKDVKLIRYELLRTKADYLSRIRVHTIVVVAAVRLDVKNWWTSKRMVFNRTANPRRLIPDAATLNCRLVEYGSQPRKTSSVNELSSEWRISHNFLHYHSQLPWPVKWRRPLAELRIRSLCYVSHTHDRGFLSRSLPALLMKFKPYIQSTNIRDSSWMRGSSLKYNQMRVVCFQE